MMTGLTRRQLMATAAAALAAGVAPRAAMAATVLRYGNAG